MHFHVPIFVERYGALESTQDHLRAVHRARARQHLAPGDRDLHVGRAAGRPEGLVGRLDRARVRVGARCPPLRRHAVPAGGWLQLARISNTPTVVSNSVAGAVLASASPDAGTVAVVARRDGALLHRRHDPQRPRSTTTSTVRERPERPLPSGGSAPAAALAAVVSLFAAGEALLLLEGDRAVARRARADRADRPLRRLAQGQPALAGAHGRVPRARLLRRRLRRGRRAPDRGGGAAAVLLLYIVGLTQVAKAEGGTLARGVAAGRRARAPSPTGPAGLNSVWYVLLLAAFAAWACAVAVARALAAADRRRRGQPDRRRLAVRRARGGERRGQPGGRGACAWPPSLVTIALQTKIAGT